MFRHCSCEAEGTDFVDVKQIQILLVCGWKFRHGLRKAGCTDIVKSVNKIVTLSVSQACHVHNGICIFPNLYK